MSRETITIKLMWALLWRSKNKLDGVTTHYIFKECQLVLFSSRKEARAFAEEKYGYIRDREDLKKEPHGWTVPKAVKVRVTITT